MNKETGLVEEGQLDQIIIVKTLRPNGTWRIQRDYKYCPTLAEQHSARETDLNYLIKKYKPDELAAYLVARDSYRQEIIGQDFSAEPSLEDARNITYRLKRAYDQLPEEVKNKFKNHVEFLKFIDNPANQEKMIELGLLTKKQIKEHTEPHQTAPRDSGNVAPDNEKDKPKK